MLEMPFVFSRDTGIPEEEVLLSSWNDLHQQQAGTGTNDKILWFFSCLTDSSDSRGESCSPFLKGIPEEGNRRKSERKTAASNHRAVFWISTESQTGVAQERPHNSATSPKQRGKLDFISHLL